jgi:hypothetical protein
MKDIIEEFKISKAQHIVVVDRTCFCLTTAILLKKLDS